MSCEEFSREGLDSAKFQPFWEVKINFPLD